MAILGVVGEADPPPVKFTPAFWHGCHLPIIVCFTIFISTAWVFSCAVLSDVYDLDIHLRAPSVLEVPIIFSVRSFPEEALKFSVKFIVLPEFSERVLRRCQKTY